jgi:predicted nucleotidyltransferase
MVDIEELKHKIVERLKPLDPHKIILFGSYAYGTPKQDSDIDLYVVTKDEFMPQSFKEKSELHLKVARAIKDLMKDIPTDLITHTKAMHSKFIEMDSMFSRKILKDGISLL